MSKCNSTVRTLAIGLAGLILWSSTGVAAQQRTTTSPNRAGGGTGASSGTASGTTRQYTPNGTVGDAMISVDPETHRVIVITDEETSKYVGQVITNLDRPEPQVLIKVVFLEVTHNNSLDIGIEGAFSRNLNNTTTGIVANAFGLSSLNSAVGTNTAVNAFGQAVQSFVPTPPGAGLYQVLGSDFQATLRAIAQAGKTEVLSRPSILARNNQQATITVGQSVPLVTSVSYNGLNGTPVSAISYQSVGIILRVTPFINSNGMVEMIVSPQISQLSAQSVTVSAGVSAPVIDLRSADTVVVTPDGQTVIIGGLMQNQKTQSDSKIPILGDIPLLGNLFKRKVKANTKTELMIFLTPHVVYEPAQLASLSTTERGIADITSGVIGSASFRGILFQDRLESALNRLVKPDELISAALLNATNGIVASVGKPLDLDLTGLTQDREHWGQTTVTFVNPVPVESSAGFSPPGETNHATTIVLAPPRRESSRGPREAEPPPSRGDPPPDDGRAAPHSEASSNPPPAGNINSGETTSTNRAERRPERPRFGRPPWRSEEERKSLIEGRGLHGLVLVMSTEAFSQTCQQDLWLRLIIGGFASIAVVGLGLAWRN